MPERSCSQSQLFARAYLRCPSGDMQSTCLMASWCLPLRVSHMHGYLLAAFRNVKANCVRLLHLWNNFDWKPLDCMHELTLGPFINLCYL